MSNVDWLGLRIGFPFVAKPALTTPVGAGTAYPLGFTRLKLIRLYWRLREVKINGSFSVSYMDGTNTVTDTASFTDAGADGDAPLLLATLESQLCLGTLQSFTATASDGTHTTVDADGHTTTTEIPISFRYDINFFDTKTKLDEFGSLLYYPYFPVGIFSAGSLSSGSATLSGSVTFLDFGEIPLYVATGGLSAATDFTITGTKYWTYNGLYNETTGARL